MKYLIWIPGLFWLFPWASREYPEYADKVLVPHAFYAAAQVCAIMAGVLYFLYLYF